MKPLLQGLNWEYGKGDGEQTCCHFHSRFQFADKGSAVWLHPFLRKFKNDRTCDDRMLNSAFYHLLSTWNTHIRKQNITEQWIWTIHKATCNTTVPKLCYDIVMVRQSHGWSQRTNFKTWKSTHERIMIILTSSSRTKSNSCAAVQVKSAGSVVTVSLVPSQCSDTRVSNTQKTIDLEDDQMLQTHAFNFSQLLASATTTTIHNKNIRSSYQCFISFWNILKTCRQWTLYSLR